ncbi:MAG: chromate efflux transporter [Phycisphaerales bacterium]|nr:chromate efflux transporter [Phycisphaerales bacterium]
MTAPAEPTAPPTFAAALRFWAWLGCASFGGPAAQIARLHDELVVRRRWLDGERFDHALDFCTMLPGPEAQQLATWCGRQLHGARGGIAAGALFVLPGALLMAALSWAVMAHGAGALLQGALWGGKAVVVGLVLVAALQLGRRVARRRPLLAITVATFGALFFGAPFPLLLPAAALLGLLATPPERPAGEPAAAADMRTTKAGGAVRALALGGVLWLVPWLLLLAGGDALALPRQLYLFFSVAALATFGGAYAVLAYVADAAVRDHGWLTAQQALDSIALAEATPGPLVLALQHTGFVTGWNHAGAWPPVAAALLAAAITSWTTFLPGMTMVFAGAPALERLRRRPRARAALAGVTAAALGALLLLALGMASATLFRQRAPGSPLDALRDLAFGVADAAARQDGEWLVGRPDLAALALAAGAFALVATRRCGPLAAMALGVACGLLRGTFD